MSFVIMSSKTLKRIGCAVVSAAAIVQSAYSIAQMCGYSSLVSFLWFALSVVLTTGLVFAINGLWVEGFLIKKALIRLHSVGVEICVMRGDILDCEGVSVIAVNDFFDTLVDDHHISASSVHGKMINKFWAGSTLLLDAQISKALTNIAPIEIVKRDGSAKEQRYGIGTSVFVKTDKGRRFILTALSKTDASTHMTQSGLDMLIESVRRALDIARLHANGDPVSFYVMGRGNARIKASEQMLFATILTTIISVCQDNKVSSRINIVLHKDSPIGKMNLHDLGKEWSI